MFFEAAKLLNLLIGCRVFVEITEKTKKIAIFAAEKPISPCYP